jgi:hypothetical protein
MATSAIENAEVQDQADGMDVEHITARREEDRIWANKIVGDVFQALHEQGMQVMLRGSEQDPGSTELMVYRRGGYVVLGLVERSH